MPQQHSTIAVRIVSIFSSGTRDLQHAQSGKNSSTRLNWHNNGDCEAVLNMLIFIRNITKHWPLVLMLCVNQLVCDEVKYFLLNLKSGIGKETIIMYNMSDEVLQIFNDPNRDRRYLLRIFEAVFAKNGFIFWPSILYRRASKSPLHVKAKLLSDLVYIGWNVCSQKEPTKRIQEPWEIKWGL